MDKSLDSFKSPKLNQENLNNLSRPIRKENFEIVIKKIPGPDRFKNSTRLTMITLKMFVLIPTGKCYHRPSSRILLFAIQKGGS